MSRVFDGVDDLISLARESDFDFTKTSAFSVSFWINPNATRSGNNVNYASISKLNGSSPFEGWEIGLKWNFSSQTKMIINFAVIDTSSNQKSVYGSTDLTNGTWVHVLLTKDTSDTVGGMKAYINSVSETMTTETNNALGTITNNLNIGLGGRSSGTFRAYTGCSLSYVEIFSRELSQNDAKQLMRFPGSVSNGRLCTFPLWGASPEPDYSGNGNSGTITTGTTIGASNPPVNGFFLIPSSNLYSSFSTVTGVQFDAASNSGYQAAASTYSWNHTCTGTNRYLLVGISMLSLAQTVTGITYNGVALKFLGSKNSVSGAARVEMWGLVAPATGTNSIAVTLSGAIASAGNASSYTTVNQTSPYEAFNSAQATNVGAADATVDVTTVANNDWCVDILATDDTAVTVGAGQTQSGNVSGAGGSGAMSYEGPKTPAGAVTMSWTNVGALATWAIGSIALRPVGSSNLGTTYISRMGLMGIG